jgi:uncharacterized membrane protein YgcG
MQSPPGYPLPSGGQADGPQPVQVGFSPSAPQQRLTVLVRLLLALPHLVCLYLVLIGAYVVAFLAWFGALFTGRVPEFAGEFLGGALRWQTRVLAYELLLTDKYPPFGFEDTDYPVRLAVDPGQLNRAAVFFRIITIIPAMIVLAVASYGLAGLAFITWLIVLVTGQMPNSLHGATSSVVRYTSRCIGYFWMLTAEYPKGLYGDQPSAMDLGGAAAGYGQAVTPLGTAPAAGYGLSPGYGQPGTGFDQPAAGYGQQAGYGTQAPGYGTPAPGYGQQAGSGAPDRGYGPAAAGYGTAPDGYGQPTSGYGQPASGYGQPTPGYGQPAPGYGQPTSGYGQPASGYGQPAPGYGQPTSGYGQPTVGGQPSGYGQPPADFGQPSVSGYTPPAASYGQSAPPWGSAAGSSAPGPGAPTGDGFGTPVRTVTPGRPAGGGFGAPTAHYGAASTDSWAVPGSPPWQLVLSPGARKLVTLFLVLGVLVAIVVGATTSSLQTTSSHPQSTFGGGTGSAGGTGSGNGGPGSGGSSTGTGGAGGTPLSRQAALNRTQGQFHTLENAVSAYSTAEGSCGTGDLGCVTRADKKVAKAFAAMAAGQRAMTMPTPGAQAASKALIKVLHKGNRIFHSLGTASSDTQYIQRSEKIKLQTFLGSLGKDYSNLIVAIDTT